MNMLIKGYNDYSQKNENDPLIAWYENLKYQKDDAADGVLCTMRWW